MQGDADIFFPTDFWLLERIDHFCSGSLKLHEDASSSKRGKKRRTITLDTSSFMEEFGLPSRTRTKDGYNPLLDDFKNTKFYLSVPTHNVKWGISHAQVSESTATLMEEKIDSGFLEEIQHPSKQIKVISIWSSRALADTCFASHLTCRTTLCGPLNVSCYFLTYYLFHW